jgi:hypothetical protein
MYLTSIYKNKFYFTKKLPNLKKNFIITLTGLSIRDNGHY